MASTSCPQPTKFPECPFIKHGQTLRAHYAKGLDSRFLSLLAIPLGGGIVGWVVDKRSSILNGDPKVEDRYVSDGHVSSQLRSVVSVALKGAARAMGALCIYRTEANAFVREELSILEATAIETGIALEKCLRSRISDMAEALDSITGLLNVRSLSLQLRDDLSRCRRNSYALWIVRLTVRGLDRIEKTHGWDAAKRAFTLVADALRKHCEDSHEYAARYGVEDFALVLCSSANITVEDRMVQLTETIRQISFLVCGQHLFAVSVGVARFPEDGDGSDELLSRAYESRRMNFRVFTSDSTDRESRALRVFLCHSSSDKGDVRSLYQRLEIDGVDAWLDEEKLLPGQDWRMEIERAVRNSDVVLVCLSRESVTKEGYIQKEIRHALDVAEEKPAGTIFLIPVKLGDCEVPERLGGGNGSICARRAAMIFC